VSELVLITGGAGFIGSHTADVLLERGYRVRALDSLHPQVHRGGARPAHLSDEVELVRGDVRDLAAVSRAVRGVDRVVHLAAETSVGQSLYQSDVHVDVNGRGTAVLFRAIREQGAAVERVVLSSSRAVYGEGAYDCAEHGRLNPGERHVDDLDAGTWVPRCPVCRAELEPAPSDEDVEPRFASTYGMTKLFQEQIARREAASLGVGVTVLRYFNVYGPRQSPDNPYTGLIVTFAARLLAGKPLVLYENGTPVRDFVNVRDVVGATIRALAAPAAAGRTVNVGTGRPVTLVALAGELQRAFGRTAAVELSPRFRVGDIHASVADRARLTDVLGYQPEVDIAAGLAELAPEIEALAVVDGSDDVEDELRSRGVLRGG
jgi:dTDP-L-rhamnose 4-epimerase